MIQQAQFFVAWMQTKFGVDFSLDRTEEGQGLVEYALILVLCSLVAAIAVGTLGGQISTAFGSVTSALSAAG
jgi:pilus assembly protein Flp/PilA